MRVPPRPGPSQSDPLRASSDSSVTAQIPVSALVLRGVSAPVICGSLLSSLCLCSSGALVFPETSVLGRQRMVVDFQIVKFFLARTTSEVLGC